jgi:hypothetical protein
VCSVFCSGWGKGFRVRFRFSTLIFGRPTFMLAQPCFKFSLILHKSEFWGSKRSFLTTNEIFFFCPYRMMKPYWEKFAVTVQPVTRTALTAFLTVFWRCANKMQARLQSACCCQRLAESLQSPVFYSILNLIRTNLNSHLNVLSILLSFVTDI